MTLDGRITPRPRSTEYDPEPIADYLRRMESLLEKDIERSEGEREKCLAQAERYLRLSIARQTTLDDLRRVIATVDEVS